MSVKSVALSLAIVLSAAGIVIADPEAGYRSCLPSEVKQVEVRGTATSDGVRYFYLGVSDPLGYGIAVVAVDGNSCELAIPPEDIETELFEVMPPAAAKEIWLGNYRFAIEKAGSVESLEAILQEEVDPVETYTYRSELQVEALEELGIAFPDSYTLTSHDPERQAALKAFLASDPSGPKFVNDLQTADDYAIARWILFDRSGRAIGQQVDGEWQVLGFTTEEDEPILPESLQSRFGIPLETARELLGS